MSDAKPPTEREIAQQMTAYLFTSPGYNRDSVLTEIVKARISQMARDVAAVVIGHNDELHQLLQEKTEQVLRQAMQDDTWFNKIVIDAVAKALHDAALNAPTDY